MYAIFCTHQLNLHTYTDRMWAKLEEAVQPENADLFAAHNAVASVNTDTDTSPAAAPAPAPATRPVLKKPTPAAPARVNQSTNEGWDFERRN